MIEIATPDTKVAGEYLGVPFRGTVLPSTRYHTLNPHIVIVQVELDDPIMVGGLTRTRLCCEVGYDGLACDGFDLATVRLAEDDADAVYDAWLTSKGL